MPRGKPFNVGVSGRDSEADLSATLSAGRVMESTFAILVADEDNVVGPIEVADKIGAGDMRDIDRREFLEIGPLPHLNEPLSTLDDGFSIEWRQLMFGGAGPTALTRAATNNYILLATGGAKCVAKFTVGNGASAWWDMGMKIGDDLIVAETEADTLTSWLNERRVTTGARCRDGSEQVLVFGADFSFER